MNSVYLGVSLDGFIADRDGGLEWLDQIPNPNKDDMGYPAFMNRIDALVMGKNTFETVLGFDVDWPYQKKVFVLSNTRKDIPENLSDKVEILKGDLKNVLAIIHQQGYERLYIDGGKLIQSFLEEDLIDEMILTTIPVLLGGGVPLFGDLNDHRWFKCESSRVLLDHMVQTHYVRNRPGN